MLLQAKCAEVSSHLWYKVMVPDLSSPSIVHKPWTKAGLESLPCGTASLCPLLSPSHNTACVAKVLADTPLSHSSPTLQAWRACSCS